MSNRHVEYRRGQVYYANLGQRAGSEEGGERTVLILQNNTGNKHSPTLIVASISSSPRKKNHMPTHVELGVMDGLLDDCVCMLEQIHTIDKQYMRDYVTCLSRSTMRKVEYALGVSLYINPLNLISTMEEES